MAILIRFRDSGDRAFLLLQHEVKQQYLVSKVFTIQNSLEWDEQRISLL